MLKANVGLSRKITHDYNSTGYSVNLEGEILAATDDVEAIAEKIKELFSLAEETLTQEMERHHGDNIKGRREEERPPGNTTNNGPVHPDAPGNGSPTSPASSNGSKPGQNSNEELATNKQVQFLLTMGKRFKITTPQLENRVAEIVGRRCGLYDLTKREAGLVLDHFTRDSKGTTKDKSQQAH